MSSRLVLVRHAQAEGNHPRGDHERALTDSGRLDATQLGRWLGRHDLGPDHVLVSTAVRTQQTLEALMLGLGTDSDPPTWTDRRIYEGGVDGTVAAVREAPEEAQVLWVVGHEPVMSTTTWELSDPARMADDLREQLSSGFPTATAAALELDEVWGAVGFGSGRLVAMHTARD